MRPGSRSTSSKLLGPLPNARRLGGLVLAAVLAIASFTHCLLAPDALIGWAGFLTSSAVLFVSLHVHAAYPRSSSPAFRAILKAAEQMAQGDLDARAPEAGTAEDVLLARCLNQMAQEQARTEGCLRESRRKIERSLVAAIADQRRIMRALEHKERTISSIISTAADGIIAFDSSFSVMLCNPAAEKLFGYPSEELLHAHVANLIFPSVGARERRFVKRALTSRRFRKAAQWHLELTGYTRERRAFPVDVQVGFFYAGGQMFYTAFIRDLSYRRELEMQVRQSERLESLGALSAGIAHEINSPSQFIMQNMLFLKDACSAMNEFLELAKGLATLKPGCVEFGALQAQVRATYETREIGYLREEVGKAIQQSYEGVERIAGIVQAMKRFAHPDTSRLELVQLDKIVRDAVTISRNEWKYIAEVMSELSSEAVPVRANPSLLCQVIVNLLVNAAHAVEERYGTRDVGRGRIRVGITREKPDTVCLSVHDNGCGIPEEIRERIFDPFFTTKTVGRGTGQGLSFAFRTIESFGGTIEVLWGEGLGTTFHILLPVDCSNPDVLEEESSQEDHCPGELTDSLLFDSVLRQI